MDILGYLFIWLLCGLLAGAIYKSKGRPALTGFLAGAILGPIGLILALLSGPNKEALRKREDTEDLKRVERGELRKCPYCSELIKGDAKVCRFCGRDLVEIPAPPPQAQV